MAIKQVVQIGNPILLERCEEVYDYSSKETLQIVGDLVDTLRSFGDKLIGISAPQIGYNKRIFVTEISDQPHRNKHELDNLRIYINPKIVDHSEEYIVLYEGCGSIADSIILGPVNRPRIITLKAFDLSAKEFTISCNGILSRVIQHEQDHLDGVLFIKRMNDILELVSESYYRENIHNLISLKEGRKVTFKELTYKNDVS